MLRASIGKLIATAACLGMAGCVTAPMDERARLMDIPWASSHSDVAFTISTAARRTATCEENTDCPTQSERDAAMQFALQVRRVADALQVGVRFLYPDNARGDPASPGNRFDVYVVEGAELGSASSANGRIAINEAMGIQLPYDDWLAFVIAREMGHVIAHHHEENSAASIATSLIMNILIPGSGLLKSVLSAGGSGIAARSHADVQALEADAIAFRLLEAAGFRLRDVALSLALAPALLNDSQWSTRFRKSSENLVAEFRSSQLAVAALKVDLPIVP